MLKNSGNMLKYSRTPQIVLARLLGTSELSERVVKEIEESKAKMRWRYSPQNKPNAWYSKLSLFGNDEQNSDFISMLQQPMDFSPSGIKTWWKNRMVEHERFLQRYIPERHYILGNDLAAAHFITYRGGSVKFVNQLNWLKVDEKDKDDLPLPTKSDPSWMVEALRCDNMTLYYEAMENLRNLSNLKFLSFHNVKTFDDWCLDSISGSQLEKLEILDISSTSVTARGLSCIYRLRHLKLLVVTDPKISNEFELACALLEDSFPNLRVCPETEVH